MAWGDGVGNAYKVTHDIVIHLGLQSLRLRQLAQAKFFAPFPQYGGDVVWLVHAETLDEDLAALEADLCATRGYCQGLPRPPRVHSARGAPPLNGVDRRRKNDEIENWEAREQPALGR